MASLPGNTEKVYRVVVDTNVDSIDRHRLDAYNSSRRYPYTPEEMINRAQSEARMYTHRPSCKANLNSILGQFPVKAWIEESGFNWVKPDN